MLIMKNFYARNRRRLAQKLKDGLIVLTSSAETMRNSDVNHLFRQDSDFLYLSGIEDPHHCLLIDPKTKKSSLFIPDIHLLNRVGEGNKFKKKEVKKNMALILFSTVAISKKFSQN